MQTEQSFNQFYERHHKRVHYQIHRLGITGDWYDQFYQEGIIALWRAYSSHDEAKGAIGTYLNYQIRYRLLDLLRNKMRQKNKTEKLMNESKLHLDDGNRHKGTDKPLIQYTDIDLKDNAFWKEVRQHLNHNQWKWVQYFLIAELSIKEIMEIENVSQDTVKNWGRATRKKLKQPNVEQRLKALIRD